MIILVNGRFTWEHIIYRTAQKPAGEIIGGKPADGIPADRNPPSKEDVDEHGHEDEMQRVPHSQAPAAAIDETPDLPEDRNWRDKDRELWRELVEGPLTSDGTGPWAAGTFTADAFYLGYRKRGKKWPGRWLQQISGYDLELGNWLLNEGLERVQAGGR